MRKSIVTPAPAAPSPIGDAWRDLVRIARVEMTSEDEAFPIENALGKTLTTGWRAATTGPQIIRLHFDEPIAVRRLQLHFIERAAERSQEFAVFVNGDEGAMKEILRQQWTFSPSGATEEIEDFPLALTGITQLELRIDPDRSHVASDSQSYASLTGLKIA